MAILEDENTLMTRVGAGDKAAFTQLYHRHRDRVYAFAYRMVGTRSVAEDVTHEAFLVLIEHPNRYNSAQGTVLTFLCTIARYKLISYLRRQGREVEDEFSPGGPIESQIDMESDPLSALLEDELAAVVSAAVDDLPALQREVIVLREFQDLSYEEIAAVTNADTSVVKARLHRARQSLTKRLSPYFNARKGGECHELR